MSCPSRNAADGEDRGIEIDGNAEHVISRRGIEIHIGTDRLSLAGHFLDDDLLNPMRDIEPFRFALSDSQLPRHLPQVCRARVFSVIDGMADPHYLLSGSEFLLHIGVYILDRTDLHQHFHDLLVGPAMQWPG